MFCHSIAVQDLAIAPHEEDRLTQSVEHFLVRRIRAVRRCQSGTGGQEAAEVAGGGFRLSGGLRINGNKARGIGEPNDGTSFDINGTTYTAGQIGTLRADTDINSVAPALTLGYGGGLVKGVYFGVEAGALFQGSVKIKPLTITGTCSASPTPAGCGDILEDLEQERLSVNDDIHKYKVYPILQLSLGYRF